MFACTGSEANELALRLARAYTGGTGVIVADFAYHGNTQATSDISPEETPLAQLPDHVAVVPCPDVYRGEHRDDTAADRYANHVADALRVLDDRRIRPAAFVVDTILSSSGVLELPDGYLRKAAAIVRDAGALFIADEVQPGFGRTGSNFWGYQAADVVPDIVTMGKPMGNGHPVSAIAARRDIVDAFASQGSYFNTFGGNPVSCAAVLAVLEVIEEDGLQANARDVGRHLRSGLAALADRHSAIGDVRGNGLFQGVDFVTDRDTRHPDARLAKRVMNGLRDRGVLTGVIGPHSNILKLRPPMVATAEHADYLLERLDEVLASL
jgi:4-aminobutyrate aminotransferase-like enzyme